MGKMTIPFFRPDVGEQEIAAVVETLRSGWLTTGPRTKEFEMKFAEYLGVNHCVALASCTAALHLALTAIGLERDDEVITTPYTFVASSEVILYHNARPVFVDILDQDFNMDPEKIEAAITPKTKAILPVHIAGTPCRMDEILDIAKRHNLRVVEDAAHATETRYKDQKIGTLSDATAFSFYATKNLVTGEGGMLATNNSEIAAKAARLSLHGMSKDAWKRYDKGGAWFYEIVDNGYKYNMTDMQASLGLIQLNRLSEMRVRRLQIVSHYLKALGEYPELFQLPDSGKGHLHAWHLFLLRLQPNTLNIDRARFIEELAKQGVQTSVHFIPLHLHPWYKKNLATKEGDYPVAEQAYQREITLPLFPRQTLDEAKYICDACIEIARKHRA